MVAERKKPAPSDARAGAEQANAPDQVKERRPDFLTARQLAQLLQVSESTIHRLRRSGRIPAVVLTGKLIRFNLRDVSRALRPKEGGHSRTEAAEGTEEALEESPQLSFDDIYSGFKL